MVDVDALATLLNTDSRFDAAVRSGNNGAILRALQAEDESGTYVYDDLPQWQLTAALAGETLTAQQETDVTRYLQAEGRLRLTDTNNRAWFGTLPQAAQDRIIAYVRRRPTVAESEGVTVPNHPVQLKHVRQAVRRVSKSFIRSTDQA